ncbi:hypothetical protein K8I61_05265 [bacterium]|nr:hypothetical protein [bacterium]
MNAEWHKKHPMPKNPTTEQRIAWHREHAVVCACREIPPKLLATMRENDAKNARAESAMSEPQTKAR